jgi:hypothetical protein
MNSPFLAVLVFPIFVEANVVWHCHELLWLSSFTKSRKMDEDRGLEVEK